ncbi:MAG TPA: glycogen synthase [Polyangiaceae bacterium]|nr:glycogen synthase [Polyangiaceae bacterium]
MTLRPGRYKTDHLVTEDALKIALLTREYPPEVYGGAGVHVEYLARELSKHVHLSVQCFGAERQAPEVGGAHQPWDKLEGKAPHLAALRTLSVDVLMAKAVEGTSLVHSHTWYANLAGHLAKLMYGIPHVMTSHSLEPLRPWKAEQLAGGYAISCFCEKVAIESADAIIAVSHGMRNDILRSYPGVDPARIAVIYNGIDTDEFQPAGDPSVLAQFGVDPERPAAVFVGRITRQKGVVHLLSAARHFDPSVQLVLCAGEPDTPEIGAEVNALVLELRAERTGVVWIDEMMPRHQLRALLGAASMFVCPSVYEPFGIVNVEAMACGLPVVASAVGGIPEVVVDGETGSLVHFLPDSHGNPQDPDGFAKAFADSVNSLARNPALAKEMGQAGRRRAVEHFSWRSIGEQTLALYQSLVRPRTRE